VPPPGFIINRNSGVYDAEGTLLRQSVDTVRDAGDPYDAPAGHEIRGESALLDQDGRVKLRWVKTREGATSNGLIEALQAAFAGHAGTAPVIKPPADADADLLTVYPLPDLHFGMYAWGRETGADYDTDIAEGVVTDAVTGLVAQSRPSGHAIILGLGDYFHANDLKAVTPEGGNRLDVDGRWPRVFATGARVAVHLVDLVAARHKSISIVFLPGNHDPDAATSLTVALALFYETNKRINVWQEPGIAWYHRFGRVLLGATHGHTMKPDRMAMMLAADRPQDWGASRFRSFFFGHIHSETAREVAGVRVESFNAPAARDGWNNSMGFRSGRAMSAITFHRERGEIGRHRVEIVTPDEHTPEGAPCS
jgi:predicted phosphodiesterase